MPFVHVLDIEQVRASLRADAEAIVCVPVFDAYDDVVQCLSALISHTAPDVPVLVLDDGSREPRLRTLSFGGSREVVIWHRADNVGFVANVNAAFTATGKSDVVVVNSDVIVGAGWLERLRAAAYSASTVATATPLTNHGALLSVGSGRNTPSRRLPDGLLPAQAAERVAKYAKGLHPLIPTSIGHCTYFRRSALDVVGSFDEEFSPGYSEEVDFSQRALAHGLVHVCADDVFVYHKGGSSFGRSDAVKKIMADHEGLIAKRYPYYFPWVRDVDRDQSSALAASLLVANAAISGMRVIVDGWCLGPTTTGSQVVVLETVRSLARQPDVSDITVFVPQSISVSQQAALEASGAKVLVGVGPEHAGAPTYGDLVYRPYQVTRAAELQWLLGVAPRAVVCQLDCIAYNNPGYFADPGQWSAYRKANQMASRFVDGLTFLSQSGLRQAHSSGLVPDNAATAIVHSGTDRPRAPAPPKVPMGIGADISGFFLCLGVSYKHKNRLLAMRIWAAACERGWTGGLVLAGPTPPDGNSLADEDQFLLEHPELSANFWRLGALSEAEKNWLYDRAALVLYPSLSEGFGLVPFEAAAQNVPCLSTRAGSLDEILPLDIPAIDIGDLDATVTVAMEMARPGPLREAVCKSLNVRAADFTWEVTAQRLVEFFWEVLARPAHQPSRSAQPRSATRFPAGTMALHQALGQLRWTTVRSVHYVVARPGLRRLVAPPGSLRYRSAHSFVLFLDRRARSR